MTVYRRYQRGRFGAGTIVIRISPEGETLRAFLRTIKTDQDEDLDAVYPSEQSTPENAFRLAENKRLKSPGAEIVVEMDPGVAWNPEWGSLEADAPRNGLAFEKVESVFGFTRPAFRTEAG